MRFVMSIWLLILSSLFVFTFAIVSHQFLAPTVSSSILGGGFIVGSWVLGLASAGTIHVLYRRAERAIEKAARDETIVQLAGAVAHELNQPLTVVISSAELIGSRERSPEDMKALVERMAEASQRMADIVGKLQHATYYRTKPYVGTVRIVDLDKAS